jgi:hypothetical protein
LALVLIGVLLVEGLFASFTTRSDWSQGVAVLDISQAVADSAAGTGILLRPVADAISGTDQFYQLAATEMMVLTDLSDNPLQELEMVATGVAGFYQEASTELALVLDFSRPRSWNANVAGAYIENY